MKQILVLVALLVALLPCAASATYTQQFALGADSTFQGQVAVAMQITAANVMTEAVTVAGHQARASFAVQVIQNPTKWNPILAQFLAAQTNNAMTPLTLPSTVADTLVQTAMDAQWSNISGYFKQQIG
jgi:hypothetical protein